jgi:hypothetical protein
MYIYIYINLHIHVYIYIKDCVVYINNVCCMGGVEISRISYTKSDLIPVCFEMLVRYSSCEPHILT